MFLSITISTPRSWWKSVPWKNLGALTMLWKYFIWKVWILFWRTPKSGCSLSKLVLGSVFKGVFYVSPTQNIFQTGQKDSSQRTLLSWRVLSYTIFVYCCFINFVICKMCIRRLISLSLICYFLVGDFVYRVLSWC